MKRFASLLACLVIGISLTKPGHADPVPAQSKISAVTVYADRALVTRSAKVKLGAGEGSVAFEGLPAGLQDETVAAAVTSGSARILGIDLQRKTLGEAQDETVRALQKEIEQITDKQREVASRAEVARKQIEFADKLQVYQIDKVSKELALKETKPEEWDSALKFLGKTRIEQLTVIRDAENEMRELNRTLTVKQAELAKVNSARSTETCAVVVHLLSKDAGEAVLNLRYMIDGAKWEPSYDARAEVGGETVELTYFGTVSQITGEEWNEVEVALSTAQPRVGAYLPDLPPVYLSAGDFNFADSVSRTSAYSVGAIGGEGGKLTLSPVPGAAPPASTELMPVPEQEASSWETATLETRGAAALYKVPRQQTIPTGNRPKRVTISSDKYKATMTYVTRPKLQPFAFLRAMVKNTSENQLISGQANVFVGGDFIGQSRVESIAPQQEFPLFLGIDDRLKVKREPVLEKRRETFWGKKIVMAVAFRITVENYTGAKQTVHVGDQKPVSKDASIVVRNFKADLDPSEVKEEKGKIEWKLELKPNEKRVIEFGYEVVFSEEISARPGVRERIQVYEKML